MLNHSKSEAVLDLFKNVQWQMETKSQEHH